MILDQIRASPAEDEAADPLAPVGGLFVGRDDLFWQLETAALLQHVAVLAGPGGTGKTELAKGFARWQRDTGAVRVHVPFIDAHPQTRKQQAPDAGLHGDLEDLHWQSPPPRTVGVNIPSAKHQIP